MTRELEQISEAHIYRLRVPPDLEYFDGHFEGAPILAAVVQLDVVVLPRVERLWPDLGPVERATKMKFRSPIRAAEEIEVTLTRAAGKNRVDVVVKKADRECSSGSLFFS